MVWKWMWKKMKWEQNGRSSNRGYPHFLKIFYIKGQVPRGGAANLFHFVSFSESRVVLTNVLVQKNRTPFFWSTYSPFIWVLMVLIPNLLLLLCFNFGMYFTLLKIIILENHSIKCLKNMAKYHFQTVLPWRKLWFSQVFGVGVGMSTCFPKFQNLNYHGLDTMVKKIFINTLLIKKLEYVYILQIKFVYLYYKI